MRRFVHDPHHAFATPARTLLSLMGEVAIRTSGNVLTKLVAEISALGFPPRLSVGAKQRPTTVLV